MGCTNDCFFALYSYNNIAYNITIFILILQRMHYNYSVMFKLWENDYKMGVVLSLTGH